MTSEQPRHLPDTFVPSSEYRVDRLRMRHLRLLELVAREGSLGGAARMLGVSQPACTLLLRELEAVFGARLVERSPRGGRLTVAGVRALERLAIALASVTQAIDAARAPALEPLLRVGCIQVAGVAFLPAALAHLERTGAPIRLAIREGRTLDLVRMLVAGELDCTIGWMDESVMGAAPIAELAMTPLWQGHMQVVAAAGHPLARRRAIAVADLTRWRWISPAPESRTHAAYLRLFATAGLAPPPVAIECPALHTMLHMVAATRHLAIAPDSAVQAYARRGMVARLKGPALDLGYNKVSLATRRDSVSLPTLARFRDALLSVAE